MDETKTETATKDIAPVDVNIAAEECEAAGEDEGSPGGGRTFILDQERVIVFALVTHLYTS